MVRALSTAVQARRRRELRLTSSWEPPNDSDLLRCHQSMHCAPSPPISGQRFERLSEMLSSALNKEIGERNDTLPTKECLRKFKHTIFCIGINNVTRALEMMPIVQNKWRQKKPPDLSAIISKPIQGGEGGNQACIRSANYNKTMSSLNATHLQAVIVASDVHPRLLVSHLPDLTASRNVPFLTISAGNGTGSVRLGRIFNLRTAIAVGLKNGDFAINRAMRSFLDDMP